MNKLNPSIRLRSFATKNSATSNVNDHSSTCANQISTSTSTSTSTSASLKSKKRCPSHELFLFRNLLKVRSFLSNLSTTTSATTATTATTSGREKHGRQRQIITTLVLLAIMTLYRNHHNSHTTVTTTNNIYIRRNKLDHGIGLTLFVFSPRPRIMGALQNLEWSPQRQGRRRQQQRQQRKSSSHGLLHIHYVDEILFSTTTDRHHDHRHDRHHHNHRHHNHHDHHDTGEFFELSNKQKDDQEEEDDDNDEELYQPYKQNPECQPMHKWQTKSNPTCNIIHEQPLNTVTSSSSSSSSSSSQYTKLVAEGWWRMTLRIMDNNPFFINQAQHHKHHQHQPIAFKTLRMDRPISAKYIMKKHEIYAIIYDRMTPSKHIMDIYAYCSIAGLYEFANGDDGQQHPTTYTLEEYLLEMKKGFELDKIGRLTVALEVLQGLADLHSIDSINGHSAIVHSDIIINQYVKTNEGFKLNDFNRGHLMYWNTTSNESTCTYANDEPNPGIQRAPEEIIYSNNQSEKIDTWSMGHILFVILTNEYSFDENEIDMEDVQKLIMKGKRPKIPKKFRGRDNHPVDKVLLHAIDMCLVQDWRERYSSVEVRDYLARELDLISKKRIL